MKAERRHELQHNELADWVGGLIEQAKPHAGVIVGLIAAVILAIVGYAFFSSRSAGGNGPAWDAYFRAIETEGFDQRVKELNRVAEEHPGTPAALWAQLGAANSCLLEGTNLSYKNRQAGEEQLSKASDLFRTVADDAAKLNPVQGEDLRQQALWGVAQTSEALADAPGAIDKYEEIAKLWPDSAYGKAAAEHAKKLNGMEEWFKWYASVDPKSIKPSSQDRQPPLDFGGSRQPGPYDDLPDVSLPGPLGLDSTTGGDLLVEPSGGATEKPTTDKPSGDDLTQPETPPAGETATPPSEDTKPAADGAAAPAPEEKTEEKKPADAPETPAPAGEAPQESGN